VITFEQRGQRGRPADDTMANSAGFAIAVGRAHRRRPARKGVVCHASRQHATFPLRARFNGRRGRWPALGSAGSSPNRAGDRHHYASVGSPAQPGSSDPLARGRHALGYSRPRQSPKLSRCAAAVGVLSPPRYAAARTGEVHAIASDTEAREDLGWKPSIKLVDGIQRAVHWVRGALETVPPARVDP
jgi:hypothetical protein